MSEATTKEPPKRTRRKRAKQIKFCDTFDELPESVQTAVKNYSEALAERMNWQEHENSYRAELRAAMKEHELTFVPDPRDEEKVFSLEIGEPEEKLRKIAKKKALANMGRADEDA